MVDFKERAEQRRQIKDIRDKIEKTRIYLDEVGRVHPDTLGHLGVDTITTVGIEPSRYSVSLSATRSHGRSLCRLDRTSPDMNLFIRSYPYGHNRDWSPAEWIPNEGLIINIADGKVIKIEGVHIPDYVLRLIHPTRFDLNRIGDQQSYVGLLRAYTFLSDY